MSDRLAQHLRQWAAPAVLFAAITLAITYPLIRFVDSSFPHDAGDPTLNTWLLWWSTERVPLTDAWWNAPMFYPMRDAMALSELLLGLLPMTAPVQWLTGNPLLAYNTAFLLSFMLCGLAAYGLALDLTGRRDAALLAGLVFAFGPYRMNHLAHIQMLAYYWAPVALLGLHRYACSATLFGHRSRSSHASFGQTRRSTSGAEAVGSRSAWLGVFAGAWLMQALTNGYALFHLSVLIVLWLIWFVRDLKVLVPIGVAWSAAVLPLVPVLLKYREAHERLHLARNINEIKGFSADVAGFLSAPPTVAIWGGRLLPSQFETALFPGLTVAALLLVAGLLAFRQRVREPRRGSRSRTLVGVIGAACAAVACSVLLFGPWAVGSVLTVGNFHKPFSLAVLAGLLWLAGSAWWRRAWRERSVPVFYVAAALALYLLSLGPAPRFLGQQILYEPPYAWLMRLPGFDVLRVPARFGMLALLCQAMVVALAFARWTRWSSSCRSMVAILLGLGVLADGWIRLPVVVAPAPARASAGQAPVSEASSGLVPVVGASPWQALSSAGVNAVIELPPGEPIVDFPALYRGMSHGQRLVNGYSGFVPPHYLPLVYAIGHRQPAALEELAADGPIGVAVDRSLNWHNDMEAAVSTLEGAQPLTADDRWATFVVRGRPRSSIRLGQRLTPAGIRANRQEQDVARLADLRVESAWGPGTPQDGGEEVVVDLQSRQIVGAVVLSMGAYSFGFPRELAIDVSVDGRDWQTVWRGDTSVLTVRAALTDPARVPVTFELGSASGRFVRLRQLGRDAVVPWWIAELEVYGR